MAKRRIQHSRSRKALPKGGPRRKAAGRAAAPRRSPAPRRKGWLVLAVEAAMEFTGERKAELSGFLSVVGSLALLLSLVPREPNLLGPVGHALLRVFFGGLGLGSYVLALLLGAWGLALMAGRPPRTPAVKAGGAALLVLPALVLVHLAFAAPLQAGPVQGLYWGGLFGKALCQVLDRYFSGVGTVVICLALMGVALYLLEQESLVKNAFWQVLERVKIGFQVRGLGGRAAARAAEPARRVRRVRQVQAGEEEQEPAGAAGRAKPRVEEAVASAGEKEEAGEPGEAAPVERLISAEERQKVAEAFLKNRQAIKVSAGGPRVNEAASASAVVSTEAALAQPRTELTDYKLPPVSLLKEAAGGGKSAPSDYQEISATLEKALASFGVAAKVVEVCPGPSVTRYEISLAPGVKMSRVVTLADDIALASKVASVRIEGPIQGKGTLGVEIPNVKPNPVLLKELVDTGEFTQAGHKLVFAVGKDIGGSMVFSNLAEMPHLLVAGATGSGKSVCINAIITSILFRAAPDEVRFLMVDPKRVELTPYDSIPHLLRPVIANAKEAPGALRLMVEEMEQRYKLLASVGMRKIDDYNAWVAEREAEKEGLEPIPGEELAEIPKDAPKDQHRRLPYIVVVIDELADLMMVSANEVENSIARLAQMARGVGIHLVIATQRPSVDVITGVIKANFPSRIAFQVSSKVDSRTILDGSGAEALLGRGDMLYSPYNVNKPVRVQGCFVSGGEVEKVVAHVKKQAQPVFDPRFASLPREGEEAGAPGGSGGAAQEDPLYEEAVRAVINAGQASTSVLQRRMRIGYGRAARLLDLMFEEGIIGPPDGNRPRKVLLNPADYSEQNLAVSAPPNEETW